MSASFMDLGRQRATIVLAILLAWASCARGQEYFDAAKEELPSAEEVDLDAPATTLESQCNLWLYAESQHGIVGLLGYDAWKGISDMGWTNSGIHSGLNYGKRLGRISDATGIGFQIGATMGVYNWSGTDYRFSSNDQAQPQGSETLHRTPARVCKKCKDRFNL